MDAAAKHVAAAQAVLAARLAANKARVRRHRANETSIRVKMLKKLTKLACEYDQLVQAYMESCRQAAPSPPQACVTPPHASVKHARSPPVGSWDEEKMPMEKCSALSPVSAVQFYEMLEKASPDTAEKVAMYFTIDEVKDFALAFSRFAKHERSLVD